MFKDWLQITTTDCKILQLTKNKFVYPIFKNGQSSLNQYAKQNNCAILENNEISNAKKILIFLRDPLERFISGVHTAIEMKKRTSSVDVKKYLQQVENFKIIDRHFVPQTFWLYHLWKYYRGTVQLKPVEDLYNLIPNRTGPSIPSLTKQRQNQILKMDYKPHIEIDQKLFTKFLNTEVELTTIVKELKK